MLVPLSLLLPPRVVAPVLGREPLLELLDVVWRLTWAVLGRPTVLDLSLTPEVLRLTCGVAELLRLVLELLLRDTCGVAELLRLLLELLLRLTVGAVELFERETAADWLLLVVLPPCERLRPWAIASDALKIRHPMRAMLIMMFLTEVFIIVLY